MDDAEKSSFSSNSSTTGSDGGRDDDEGARSGVRSVTWAVDNSGNFNGDQRGSAEVGGYIKISDTKTTYVVLEGQLLDL